MLKQQSAALLIALVGIVAGLVVAGPVVFSAEEAPLPAPRENEGTDSNLGLPVSPTSVALGPGDVIDVKFFSVPELNESQTIRPDGRIALQLVGEVMAEGKTPERLRQELSELFAPHLKKPDVTVIVRAFQSRRVYVVGEVLQPGPVALPGPMTVIEAIMTAGGFNTRSANVDNVVLIRHKEGKRYGASLNLSQALKGKETDLLYLEPLDIVFVPRTTIVKVAQWIDQHINQLIPILGIEYTKFYSDHTLTIDLTRGRGFR